MNDNGDVIVVGEYEAGTVPVVVQDGSVVNVPIGPDPEEIAAGWAINKYSAWDRAYKESFFGVPKAWSERRAKNKDALKRRGAYRKANPKGKNRPPRANYGRGRTGF